jgi:hypothetical protein
MSAVVTDIKGFGFFSQHPQGIFSAVRYFIFTLILQCAVGPSVRLLTAHRTKFIAVE